MNRQNPDTIIAQYVQRFDELNLHKTIGEQEQLDEKTQYILELAAVVHDIACPLCREKYGNTNGKYQEIDGMYHQILIEADYIVNADESGYYKQSIGNFSESTFMTKTGIELLNSIYGS